MFFVISFFIDFWLFLQDGEEIDFIGVIIVFCMVLVSGLMCFWQEYCLGKVVEVFKVMVWNIVIVLCCDECGMCGELWEIFMGELVVGDIVCLFVGDMIFVDICLIELCDLFISQVVFIGEVLLVEKYDIFGVVCEKFVKWIVVDQQDLFELLNICFMGINVVSGMVIVVVVVIGVCIYFGLLVCFIVGLWVQIVFDCGVNSVSWLLICFMLVMVLIVLLINGFIKGDWIEVFMFVFVVVVGLILEMLLMIVSVNLVKGVVVMLWCKVVVKCFNVIQNFGVMDVFCIDKIGILIQDWIIFEYYVDVVGWCCDWVL